MPQSISNTDTEDEEDCLARPNELPKDSVDDAQVRSSVVRENGAYYPLDESKNVGNRGTRNGQNMLKYYRDDMPIMAVDGNERNDLWQRRDSVSPLRRFCLVASVLLCIVTIVIFLYVLPCDSSMVCPSTSEPRSSISWDKILQKAEFQGPISVVQGTPTSLILLVRGQWYRDENANEEPGQIPPDGGGVMSMQGDNGLPLWLVFLQRPPTEIDCVSVDTDRSGKPDCIVAGEQGLLASIDPIAGTIHWSSKIYTFDKLPLILSDVDSDGVEDFLSIELTTKNTSNLVLLSGANGHLLGRYTPENCSSVDMYHHRAFNHNVTYDCYDSTRRSAVKKTISVKGILHAMKLTEHKKLTTKSALTFRTFDAVKFDDGTNSWRPTRYHYLSIENEGSCAGESCRASLNLTLQKPGTPATVIWEHVCLNTFVSKPTFLVMSGKPYTSGFAIKFWHWNGPMREHAKRGSLVTERRLIERVLIVFVNYTDVQVMNVSQSDIVQVCRAGDCQPNLNSRARFSSIKIDCIGEDGFPELISYWSSFEVDAPNVLTSKVQVVKLDSLLTGLPRAPA